MGKSLYGLVGFRPDPEMKKLILLYAKSKRLSTDSAMCLIVSIFFDKIENPKKEVK